MRTTFTPLIKQARLRPLEGNRAGSAGTYQAREQMRNSMFGTSKDATPSPHGIHGTRNRKRLEKPEPRCHKHHRHLRFLHHTAGLPPPARLNHILARLRIDDRCRQHIPPPPLPSTFEDPPPHTPLRFASSILKFNSTNWPSSLMTLDLLLGSMRV